MRNAFATALYECALADDRICVLAADISPAGAMAEFQAKFPRRFINVGVAEQVMIGMAAGMALKGYRPFCYTIATFALYRPFEFVRDDLAYQNLPVTVVGMGSGLNYSTLGGTHQAIEDVAIASTIPNMQVIAPCDPAETMEAVRWCAMQQNGPVYLRLGKVGEPKLAVATDPWEFGKLRRIKWSPWREHHILSYGTIAGMALEVAERVNAALTVVPTLKPLDKAGISDILLHSTRVSIIEEHVLQGGLSSQVKQIAWDCGATCPLDCFTLQDKFIHFHGSRLELLALHGLSENQIVDNLRQ